MKVEHGGNLFALAKELGYEWNDCLDFSANINPFGPSEKIKDSIVASLAHLSHYPDIEYQSSRQRLAAYHGVVEDAILLANGAVELFYDLARVCKPQKLLVLQPTFMEYEKAFLQVGTEMRYLSLEVPDYNWDFEKARSCLSDFSAGDMVLICHPNNPTGTIVDQSVLVALATYLKERGIMFVLDEAFVDFLSNEREHSFIPLLAEFSNTVVIRSLTKFYAIPGLRLGYAVSYHPTCLKDIDHTRPPWTVNVLAEAALPAILSDKDYRQKTLSWLEGEKNYLYQSLARIKEISPLKPSVNYLFFTYEGDLDLRAELRVYKIFIRSCANYHSLTERHYRIAVRSREENDRLLEALQDLLGNEIADEED